jgi:hypothetical protein
MLGRDSMTEEACPVCRELGHESSVTAGSVGQTLIGIGSFSDYFTCSRGHHWRRVSGKPCPVEACSFGEEPSRTIV